MGTTSHELIGEALCAAAAATFRAVDPQYADPYIDTDEWRDEPEPHRFVHGGFTGTDLRFSMYFPPKERYAGRFLQPVLMFSGIDNACLTGMMYGRPGSLGFAFDSGAYLVESNMGTPTPDPGKDTTIPGFRGSAAAARFSRALAAQVYGPHRPYGYVFGGSGGAFKTIACVENAPDVWDGAVPFVQGSPIAIPNCFAAQARAMQVLKGKFQQIADALEPGGSGDMYAGLTSEQREALAEVTAFGFPPKAWFDVNRIRSGYTTMWSVFAEQIRNVDSTYFDDFWTVPGYLGADAPEAIANARVRATLTVEQVITVKEADTYGLPVPLALAFATDVGDQPIAVKVAGLDGIDAFGAMLEVLDGAAAGSKFYIAAVVDSIIAVGMSVRGTAGLAGVQPGDRVAIDNDDFLAFQSFARHQVMDGFDGFDRYKVAGTPIYPQRTPVGPRLGRGSWGQHQSGRFAGKMICMAALLDEGAYPWQAAWYQRQVQRVRGDARGEHHRLWFVEHAMHGSPSPVVVPGDSPRPSRLTRTIDYAGVLEQAIRDVIDWVELGIPPAPDTEHRLVDAQVLVDAPGDRRGGIQPTVRLTANGYARADVKVGESVSFVGEAIVPPGTGTVVAAEWDFLGDGDFPVADPGIDGSLDRVTVRATYTFDEPGTYFPALRVSAHRRSNLKSPYARAQNLGRVRVVVS